MNKNHFLSVCLLFTAMATFAQSNLLNAKKPEEIGIKTQLQKKADNDKPLPYGYVDDRDILWSKTIWEIIDVDERINFFYYYPIDTINIASNRKSLYDVLINNIKNGTLTDVYVDSYFTEKRSFDDLRATLTKIDTTDAGKEQFNAGEAVSAEYINKRDITAADIEEWRIKGVWYFDKRQGELKYRLLGIAPVAPDVNFIDDDEPDMVELFWVWYPSARQILHEAKAYNPGNSANPLSFDHLLNARRFNAIIYKEENIYGDREIKDYVKDNALLQLLEAQKIKEKIQNFEMDMWNY